MKLLVSIILGIALFLPSLSSSYAASLAGAEEFNTLFGTIEEKVKTKGPKTRETARLSREREQRQASQLPKLWDIMDRLVVGLLKDQKTAEDIQGVLSQLSGYKPPRPVSKTIIGNVVFSNGVDREYPNYWVTPVERDCGIHILGVYNDNLDPYRTLASRLNVYTRKKSGWVKADAFEGTTTLCLYILPRPDLGNALMTIEQYLYADCIEGNLKFWKLEASGKLRLLARYDKLLDCGVYQGADKLTIAYTKSPEHLSQPFLGTRVRFSIDVVVDKNKLQPRETCLNPWVEVLDDYFGYLRREDIQGARACLKDPQLLPLLRECSTITREEGDINSGEGVVEMNDGTRVEFQRDKGNKWVISEVLKQYHKTGIEGSP
ncbi:MAG: hypothetical protein ABSH41_28885 [Syntrophobacteraceae bacterium]|jgi:hypothetical protein